MPHILVEHSEKSIIDTSTMLHDLHHTLAGHETINLQAIKTRSVEVEYCLVGDESQSDKMVHITVRLLAGRPDDLRKAIAQSMQDTARNHVSDDTAVTVEIVDMDAVSYCK